MKCLLSTQWCWRCISISCILVSWMSACSSLTCLLDMVVRLVPATHIKKLLSCVVASLIRIAESHSSFKKLLVVVILSQITDPFFAFTCECPTYCPSLLSRQMESGEVLASPPITLTTQPGLWSDGWFLTPSEDCSSCFWAFCCLSLILLTAPLWGHGFFCISWGNYKM